MRISRSLTILAVVAASTVFAQDTLNSGFKAMRGKNAPAFRLTDIHGKVLTNQSLKGKVVVFDFWATYCGPCKAASPYMEKLYKKYGSRGLVVVGAQALDADAPNGAKDYVKEHKYTFAFTKNDDGFAHKLGIQAVPAFMILDKTGKIVRTETGVPAKVETLFPSFEKTIKPLLN